MKTQFVEKSYWFIRFCGNFATFIHLTKVQDILWGTPSFFEKKNKIWTFWEILLFQSLSTAKLITLAISKTIQTFSESLFIFSKKQKNFEQFEKTATFSCIPQQNCYLQSFQGEFIFFGESMYFFRTAKSLNVLRNVSVSVEFYCKVATASQFFQFQDFCSKNPFFILKKTEVWTFWGLLQFQSIQRQVCCFCHLERLQFFSKNRSIL